MELAKATYEHLVDLELADNTYGSRDLKIDALIGMDSYWKFVTGEIIRRHSGPVAINTTVGWILSGLCDWSGNDKITTNLISSHVLSVNYETENEQNRDDVIIKQ